MAVRVENVLRCNLHGIQGATHCSRDVLFISHDCSDRFVLSHHVVTICKHLWSQFRKRCERAAISWPMRESVHGTDFLFQGPGRLHHVKELVIRAELTGGAT